MHFSRGRRKLNERHSLLFQTISLFFFSPSPGEVFLTILSQREREREGVWSVSIPCPVTIIHSSFPSREVVIRFSIILFRYFSLIFFLFFLPTFLSHPLSFSFLKMKEEGKEDFQHVMTTSCFTLFPPPSFFSCHEFLLSCKITLKQNFPRERERKRMR